MPSKEYVLVLCRIPFYMLPLRRTIRNHLDCFRRYSSYPVLLLNVDYGIPVSLLKKINIKTVVFHTSFLVMRWTPKLFEKKTKGADFFRTLSCPKIALPQDEFIHTDLLMNFFQTVDISHIYSCAMESEWDNIYPGLRKKGVQFHTVLTGYVDEDDLKLAERYQHLSRTIDVGYRTQHVPAWLGKHGALKIKIAEETRKIASSLGLKVDISTDIKDVLVGTKWLEFLATCRAVIGVEGGASILDRDGSLQKKIDAIEKTIQDPEKSYLCEKFLKDYEGNLNLKALSPRHFEACLMRTYQILVEGEYNGVLRAYLHYFPVKKDFSNLAEALESLRNHEYVQRITEKAYQDIIASGEYTYKKFVAFIERTAFDLMPVKKSWKRRSEGSVRLLKIRIFLAETCNEILGGLFRCIPVKIQKTVLDVLKKIFHKLA